MQPTGSSERILSPRRLRKRRKKNGIEASSPISSSTIIEQQENGLSDNAISEQDNVLSEIASQRQAPDPPEIVRNDDKKSISFDQELLTISLDKADTDNESELDQTNFTSDFTTPNKFDILNTLPTDDTPKTQVGAPHDDVEVAENDAEVAENNRKLPKTTRKSPIQLRVPGRIQKRNPHL